MGWNNEPVAGRPEKVHVTNAEEIAASAGASSMPDGADVNAGAIADGAITTNIPGTISGKLRGIVVQLESIRARLPAALTGSGNLKVAVEEVALPTQVYSGHNDVAVLGTAEVLGAAQALLHGVTVKAKLTNTDDVYVGNAAVDDTNGLVLDAGESVFIAVDNISDIYVDADTADDVVSYLAS